MCRKGYGLVNKQELVKKKEIGIIVSIIIAVIAITTIVIPQENKMVVPSVLYVTMQTCQVINDTLPDPKCTPGAINPAVTQDNIDSTICVSGYTKTVRPSVSITEPLKLESMKSYGFTDSPSNYEFDHLIPLELGGAPDDMNTLWPEPHSSSCIKDGVENYLHDQVCSGNMDLKTAQNEIATNWFNYWMRVKN